MTIKTISGTYTSGYALAAKYSGVSVNPSGVIESATGANGANGSAGTGAAAGIALSLPHGGSAVNFGLIGGGQGGAGGYNASNYATGGMGGVGGVGVSLAQAGALTNYVTISGGVGGTGGGGGPGSIFYGVGGFPGAGGQGGAGGVGAAFPGVSSVFNHGEISGGVGGTGGPGGNGVEVARDELMPIFGPGGPGGVGGVGVDLTNGGVLVNGNFGQIYGGAAGVGYSGASAGTGGVALILGGPGSITNLGMIAGGQVASDAGGPGVTGTGVVISAGGVVTNGSATRSTALIDGNVGVQMSGAGTIENYGTIEGDGGTAVQLSSASETIVAQGGASFIGALAGGGGVLDLMAGKTGFVDGASGFAKVVFAAGASWVFEGDNELPSGLRVSPGGVVTVAGTLSTYGALSGPTTVEGVLAAEAGKTLSLRRGVLTNLFDSTLSGGEFQVGAGGILQLPDNAVVSNLDAGIDLLGGGATIRSLNTATFSEVSLASSLTTIGQLGTLQAGAGAVILSRGGTLTNEGTIEATGGGVLVVSGVLNDAEGGVIRGAGGDVELQNALIFGGTLAASDGGAIVIDASSAILEGNYASASSSVTVIGELGVTDGSILRISGPIDNQGVINIGARSRATTLEVINYGAFLTGGGIIELSPSGLSAILGTKFATLTNGDNTIAGAGTIGSSGLILVNDAAGVILSDGAAPLVIATGAYAVQNAGLIEGGDGKGGLTIEGALVNTGRITAFDGDLTVEGAVSGAGTATINNDGTLTFGSSFNQNVDFAAGAGELVLADSLAYTSGVVGGFSHTANATRLDLRDIGFVSAGEATWNQATRTLTVSDGKHTAHILLSGAFSPASFVCSSDGAGGTIITDPARAAAVQRFVAAATTLAPLDAGAAKTTLDYAHPVEPLLVKQAARP